MHGRVAGSFFWHEQAETGIVYQDMLVNFAIPQLDEFQPSGGFQQDGAPPHWSLEVHQLLNETFPGRWIRRAV